MKYKLVTDRTKSVLLLVEEKTSAQKRINADWYWNSKQEFMSNTGLITLFDHKVVAYYPLKEGIEWWLDDLPLLPNPFEKDVDYEQLEIQYYKELENRKEKAKNFKGQAVGRHPDILTSHEIHAKVSGFIEGYKAAQSDKQFSLKDMKKAFEAGANWQEGGTILYPDIHGFAQSLSTQQLPKEFIPTYIKERKPNTDINGDDAWIETLKTITNSESKQELVGIYKY